MLSLILKLPSKLVGKELDRMLDRVVGKKMVDAYIKKSLRDVSKGSNLCVEDKERLKKLPLKKFYKEILGVEKREELIPALSEMKIGGIKKAFSDNGFSSETGVEFFSIARTRIANLALKNPHIFKKFQIYSQRKGLELDEDIISRLGRAENLIKEDAKNIEAILMGVKDIKKMLMQFAKNEEIPEKVDEKPIPPNKEDDIREVENSIDKVSGKDVDNKTLSVVYNKLGTYEYDKGNLGKALNFFGKSLELEPQNRAAWYNKEKSDLKLRRRLENEIERAKGHVKNVETYLYEDYERESEAAKKDQIMKDVNLLEKLEKRFASFQESIELSSSGSSRKKFSSKEKTKKRKKLFKFDLDLVGRITNLTSAANIFEEEYIQGTDMNIITEYRKINKHLTELRNAYTHRETFIREG